MAASVFSEIVLATAIEVFTLTRQFNEDSYPQKVNLAIEAFRTDEGKPYVLPVVHAVENQIVETLWFNHEYLPVAGLEDFRAAAIKLILGADSPAITESRVLGIQCLGRTGCIRLAAEFLKKKLNRDTVYVSNPTWGNHRNIFQETNFTNIFKYRYWDENTNGLDINGMLEDLGNAPERSVVILHAVAHNPTGVDPTEEQWGKIADVCEARKLFVLMDNAYQGFATGNIPKDAYSSRLFVDRGFEFFIVQSFSTNFGLYNEPTGNLCVVVGDASVLDKVKSQLEILVRTMWSNPPNHGGRIVATVLNNTTLYSKWKAIVNMMAYRIKNMRQLMFDKLREKGTPGNWDHIVLQIGMFCYTGLKPAEVGRLITDYHIYLLKEGRINMCAITTSNVDYVVNAIHEVLTT